MKTTCLWITIVCSFFISMMCNATDTLPVADTKQETDEIKPLEFKLVNGQQFQLCNDLLAYLLHVPAQFDHPFRFNPITDFGLIRSLISDLSDQN